MSLSGDVKLWIVAISNIQHERIQKKIMIVYKIEFGEICAIVFRQVLQLLSRHSGASEAQGALQDVLSSLRAGYVNHTVQAIPATRPPATNEYSVSYDDFSNCKS